MSSYHYKCVLICLFILLCVYVSSYCYVKESKRFLDEDASVNADGGGGGHALRGGTGVLVGGADREEVKKVLENMWAGEKK